MTPTDPLPLLPLDTPEEWRRVVSHPDRYEVSSLGRVRSRSRHVFLGRSGFWTKAKLMPQTPGGRALNYLRVHLMGPERFAFVHRLVAEAFIGAPPFPGAVILHKDDDGRDNRAAHLRYGDRDENECDRHVRAVAPGLAAAPF